MRSNYKIFTYLLGVIFAVAVGSACSQETPETSAAVAVLKEMLTVARAEVEAMTVDQLAAAMETTDAPAIIDVRTEAEYEQGHIRNARWVPRGKLEFLAVGGAVGDLDNPMVLYCRKDGRAVLAAATLEKLGFTRVYYLEGGFEAWANGGHSIYNPHGELQVLQFEKAESADTSEAGEK